MADLKMPEINTVLIAGNLTKDPIYRTTSNGTPVVNFYIASNRRYRDAQGQWQEDVCYVGVVAWNRLADDCRNNLRKGSAVLVDGELQSRTLRMEDGSLRTIVEIKAHRIQFLNKLRSPNGRAAAPALSLDEAHEEASFEERFLSEEEARLLRGEENLDNGNA
ncbi:MAG: single-stranded DNA-binding protein [Bacteroidetes bacterium]|nr:single-stranded DNA-binding protein [Rhodothermia bacterium]MCS7155382.1 single-stranded DNA-binding protein [Bacteroidota bacterium]MCX7907525.1 single-stranded DNA-binding protein [Bacteroidota bacterium]MDW8138519.1 single-stranded DNA-binding protein [Bacteroidota bacterium]MDW8284544.1 single-stranded DNA-binding protein [Bacteroidota bacterium]